MKYKETTFKSLWLSLLPAILMAALPVLVFMVEYWGDFSWYKYGILPRTWSGLKGILFSPFLHGNAQHLWSNTIPMVVLLWLIRMLYRPIFPIVFGFIWLASGFWTWTIGGAHYVIGSSGIVYGLAAFAITAGFLSKNRQAQGIGLFTLFFYGGLVWGIFPLEFNVGISWQGHLSGLLAGMLVALILKPGLPEKPKYSWELEPEPEIPYEDQYWRLDYVPKEERKENASEEAPKVPAPVRFVYVLKRSEKDTKTPE